MIESGVMPKTGAIASRGRIAPMTVSLPEISSVSWSTFMTGKDPGGHGIFGFTDFKDSSYALRYPSFRDLGTRTIWDALGERGMRSVVINQPATYPARPIPGLLISGFVALELEKAVSPVSYLPTLKRMGYEIDLDAARCKENAHELFSSLGALLAARQAVLDDLWERESWNLMEIVVTGTDRLHHFLWRAYEDPGHPSHERFLDFYRHIDRLIGKIVSAYHKLTNTYAGFYILSDHGFTGIVQEVYLNAWLEQNGYLRFLKPEPTGLGDIHGRTKAFALDPNRIYIHLKDRFPKGTIERGARRALRQEIAGKLEQLTYEGRRVVKKIFFNEEIYHGPHAAKGPDLVVVGEPGFDMKGSVRRKEVFGRSGLQGMHTWDDAFFWSVEDHGDDLRIADLAPIILKNY